MKLRATLRNLRKIKFQGLADFRDLGMDAFVGLLEQLLP